MFKSLKYIFTMGTLALTLSACTAHSKYYGAPGSSNSGQGNPSESPGSGTPTCTPITGIVLPGSIKINNGASSTNNANVTLNIYRSEALEMRISNDENCTCGTWEPYATTKAYTLRVLNTTSSVSVQFKDYDNTVSECASASILHDNLGPVLGLSLDSTNTYVAGKDTTLNFSVKDSGVGLGTYSCTINGSATPCALNSNSDDGNKVFHSQAQGSYTFMLTAADKLGNSSTQSVTWIITATPTPSPTPVPTPTPQPTPAPTPAPTPTPQPTHPVVQNYSVQSNSKLDILLIIDNSPSMHYEQRNMAQRMSTFISQLKGLDWRIGITTTDATNQVIGDGMFVKMADLKDTYYITSAMDPAQAQIILGKTIQRKETGSSIEQGIYATYRSIERSVAAGASPNKDFYRADAAFATVVISDEDESLSGAKNNPQNLLNLIRTTWPNKAFAFHSIITKPGDLTCKNSNGRTYGVKYTEMSGLTGKGTTGGAIIGSVCESDYGSQLSGIANSCQHLNKVIQLQCEPVGTPTSSVIVRLNNANYAGAYEVKGDRLIFAANLPIGNYELLYNCY